MKPPTLRQFLHLHIARRGSFVVAKKIAKEGNFLKPSETN